MSAVAPSLRRVVTRTVAVSIAVALLLASLVVAALVQLDGQQTRLVGTVQPGVQEAGDYYQAALDAETGLRGYSLTGDRSFLEPYVSAQPVLETSGARLTALVAAAPALAVPVARLEASVERWRTEYAVPTLAALDGGGSPQADDLETGRLLFDDVRQSYTAAGGAFAVARAAALSSFQRAKTLLTVSLAVLVVGLSVLAGLVLRGLTRQVLEPLVRLGEQARAVTSGSLDQRIRGSGPAETRRLADDLERMREMLVDQLHELAVREDELRDQARELTEQADRLERSNRDLEQFAYVASHDLQEPLRKVASFCQLLQQRYGGQLDDRADTYIGFAVDGARRMQVLINDLLAFSRVGRVRNPREVDLAALTARVVGDLEGRLSDAGATVVVGDLPVVWGDPVMLGQLVQNLVGNAVKFRAPGRPAVVTVAATRTDDGDLDLTVADNGIGIEQQYAEKVFVLFQRLHSREAYEGTGIGLALCKRIVESEGGRIWFDSVPGEGTTFHAVLPAASLEPPTPHDADPDDQQRPVVAVPTAPGTL